MEIEKVKLEKAVQELLQRENRDRSPGEVSTELNSYLIEIKESVESGEIDHRRLGDEIRKNLEGDEKMLPGSVGQLLVGCISGEEACPMRKERATDVSFIYDKETGKILPLTKNVSPVSETSEAILYLNCSPENLDMESLRELTQSGFKNIKVRFKDPKKNTYVTLDSNEIKKMIFFQNFTQNNNLLFFITVVCLILLGYIYFKK